ncbi:TspO/MBR family protein [uncultured Pseudacidovorax sp.]|uniref:TspO/MBR family protein n=1 Tax=uncultured Pseudacidovorax sp. TaxID=679313 RepID=UPI0025D8A139|nr:TspO/MBR family protein [uncultured Pseudacidovorax sp.]
MPAPSFDPLHPSTRVRTPTPGRQALGLAGWLLLCFGAAAVGGVASASAASFYGMLQRPDWAPPAWLFGPVWSLLYLLMAVSAWLVWRRLGWAAAGGALALFVLQLAVNASWSWFFFAWRLGLASIVVQVALLALAGATAAAFWPRSRLAAVLLLPYLGWLCFALALATAVWRLNPAQFG